MSWKPEVMVIGEQGKWYQNGQTFATKEEAEKSAHNRYYNWMLCIDHRAVEVPDAENPVNYRWDDEFGDVML